MNNQTPFDDTSDTAHVKHTADLALARWLQQVLTIPMAAPVDSGLASDDEQTDVELSPDYHPYFYQQLPDFIMALLKQEPQATLQYAPLIFHLIGCRACHAAYLDLYDSLSAALQPDGTRLLVGQGPRSLAGIPPRMVVNLCQLLISQAEAVLREGQREHQDNDVLARGLLLQAMKCSAQMAQPGMRVQALKDLVRVATLFDGPYQRGSTDVPEREYSLQPGSSGGVRRARTVRKVDTSLRPQFTAKGEPAIYLQSDTLEGKIVQQGEQLLLQLQDLDEQLRGQHVLISVPLGALIEPVRWLGGNPLAIHSLVVVDEQGTLQTPLGSTELRLENHEDRNLLEAMFLRLKICAIQA